MKATIKENKELILEDENLMLQKENNIDRIDFEFPTMINNHSIEKFKKYIEIETEDKSVVDEIFNDTYSLTRALTKYDLITIQIVLIYEEEDIVFKTIHKNLYFKDSINADENLQQEEQSLLYKMSEKVNQLEENNTKAKDNIENLQINKVDKVEGKDLSTNDFSNEYKEKLDSLENYDDTELRQEIEENYVKNSDYATINKAGIIKMGNGANLAGNNMRISAELYNKESYETINNYTFIGKGTLENIKEKYVEEGLQASETIEKLNKKINDLESLVPVRTSL